MAMTVDDLHADRARRATEEAAKYRLTPGCDDLDNPVVYVLNLGSGVLYTVDHNRTCDCPDFQYRCAGTHGEAVCKHTLMADRLMAGVEDPYDLASLDPFKGAPRSADVPHEDPFATDAVSSEPAALTSAPVLDGDLPPHLCEPPPTTHLDRYARAMADRRLLWD